MKNDPIGAAVYNYHKHADDTPIVVKSSLIDDEELPPDYFFREYHEWPLLEKVAIKRSKGQVLDIGACAGCHSIYLQEKGLEVTALDISDGCCTVMTERGIKNVVNANIFDYTQKQFDTILLLMNGIGIAATPDGLVKLLSHLKKLLKPSGRILLDSSDLVYLYEQPDGSVLLDLNAAHYYGQVDYLLQYKNVQGEPFNWLFADQGLMADTAELTGFNLRIIEYGPHYDYLGELTLK